MCVVCEVIDYKEFFLDGYFEKRIIFALNKIR